jgi:YD repeat-containing protein
LQRLSRPGACHSSCRALEFSPDGKRLFLGPVGLTAGLLWDLEQGRVVSDLWDDADPLAQQHTCFSAAFSPNGRLLAVADFEYVYLYDAQGRLLERRSTDGQVPARLRFVDGALRVEDPASEWAAA